MRWRDGDRGGNIEDRRGLRPVAAGGIGVGGLVLAAIGYFVFGISPSDTLSAVGQINGATAQQEQQAGARAPPAIRRPSSSTSSSSRPPMSGPPSSSSRAAPISGRPAW